jgi:hypothetical protein
MKRLFLLVLLFILALAACNGNDVTGPFTVLGGRVLDEESMGVSGALVTLGRTTTTNVDGGFGISDLDRSGGTLSVTRLGYHTRSIHLEAVDFNYPQVTVTLPRLQP